MSFNVPTVQGTFGNGNLLQKVPAIDGSEAFIGTAVTAGNQNKVFTINNLQDAINQGITQVAEPVAYRHIAAFYTALAASQQIFVLLLPPAVTMAQALDPTSVTGGNLLIQAGKGQIALVGVFKSPAGGYNGGTDFVDADVSAAVTAAKTFVQYWNGKGYYFRVAIEGRVNITEESVEPDFVPNASQNGFACVVLGGSLNDGSADVGTLLGRKAAYSCDVKVGFVGNGPLPLSQVFIGDKALSSVANLDALHGSGFLTFMTYPDPGGAAGFFFGFDNMCSGDDYDRLTAGCVVDAALRTATSIYTKSLQGEFDTNTDGTIADLDAKHLEDTMTSQINTTMGSRISSVSVLVDRTVNIINTGKISITISVTPKGYADEIDVTVGLNAGN